jgi:16S rRNA (uracil1498-N3)-methyltransferase
MKIAEPQIWSDWIVLGWLGSSVSEPPAVRLLAQPGGQPLNGISLATHSPINISIGPEGGLTDAEVAAATSAGWQLVSLGPRILRVETAAVVLASVISLGAKQADLSS